jgi:hypothetical protein
MSNNLKLQELVIIIAARNFNPIILTPDFLKYSGIVPTDWELARQPVLSQNVAQVIFTNGVSIIAEPNRVMFMEAVTEVTEAKTPAIARKYCQVLPEVEYQALGINPRGYADLADARNYLHQNLLKEGAWQQVGTAPMRANLNLTYTLEKGQLSLTVSEAMLRQEDETNTPIVLFGGNFSVEASGETATQKKDSLMAALDNWAQDVKSYIELVNDKFLAGTAPKAPVVADSFILPMN